MKILNFPFFLKKRKIPTKLLILGGICYYLHSNMLSTRKRNCNLALKDRFEFSGKYIPNLDEYDEYNLCTIFPTNIYDSQKLMEIANEYKIPIMLDINSSENILTTPHFQVNLSTYNTITGFNLDRKRITIEPGVKISNLLKFLEDYNLTIPMLQNYKNSNLTIHDVMFNNFYGFNEGKFIDEYIEELTAVIPKNNKIIQIKQNDDVRLTGLNMKSFFIRHNSTFGMIIEVKLKLKKIKNFKYIAISGIENSIEESMRIASELDKKHFGVKDITILSKDKSTQILWKLKENQIDHWIKTLDEAKINFTIKDEDNYYNSILLDNKTPLRRVKIHLDKKSIPRLISQMEDYIKKFKLDAQVRCSYINNEVEILIPAIDDIQVIENSYRFIQMLHSNVLKLKGNIFINNNIKVTSKYHLMRDIGVENYYINEDLKYYFDPNYILNPHLSLKKPEIFKSIKRENKIMNYFLGKLKF